VSEEQGKTVVSRTQSKKEDKMTEEKETSRKLTRRDFVKGAAAVAGVGALASCGPAATPVPTAAPGGTAAPAPTCPPAQECPPCALSGLPEQWDYEADVVVVGYGGSGAVTAITAADAGAEVLILEKWPDDTPTEVRLTNSTRNAGGGGSVWVGSEDDARTFLRWATDEMVPDDVIDAYVAKWVDLDTWMESIGGTPTLTERGLREFPEDAPGFAAGENWRSISYDPVNASAVAWRLYRENVEQRGIEVLFETPGKRLITNPETGEVIGVEADAGGTPIYVKANKAVVLACGGFEHNEQLKKEAFRGVHFEFYANPGNTGDGVVMAQGAGADMWHMFCASGRIALARFPDTPAGTQVRLIGGEGGVIVVDQYGRRFGNEEEMAGGHASWAEAVELDPLHAEYPRNPAWTIFDETKRLAGPACTGTTKGKLPDNTVQYWVEPFSDDNSVEVEKGWILKGDTIEELTAVIQADAGNEDLRVPDGKMDPATLQETVTKFNQYCAAGEDPDFHRSEETLIPVATPPYYAIKIYPGGPNTWGGPRKNGNLEVVRADDTAIGRLYAVGELGSIDTLSYPVNNFYECVFSGRIAGENAAALESWT
jgi:3-oxosteroid 1-dehydrogenase